MCIPLSSTITVIHNTCDYYRKTSQLQVNGSLSMGGGGGRGRTTHDIMVLTRLLVQRIKLKIRSQKSMYQNIESQPLDANCYLYS